MVPNIIMEAEVRTRVMRGQVRTGALRFRGGRVITSGSTGSTPRDCAGGPSMMMSVDGQIGNGKGVLGHTDP
jgi:hypothetical protein